MEWVQSQEDTYNEEKKLPDDSSPSSAEDNQMDIDSSSPPMIELALSDEAETLIKIISQDSKTSCIVTPVADTAQHLEDVSRWTARSLKYVENRREIFDSRSFGAFDCFRTEGKNLLDFIVVSSKHLVAGDA